MIFSITPASRNGKCPSPSEMAATRSMTIGTSSEALGEVFKPFTQAARPFTATLMGPVWGSRFPTGWQTRTGDHVPIIALTANVMPSERERGFAAGITPRPVPMARPSFTPVTLDF